MASSSLKGLPENAKVVSRGRGGWPSWAILIDGHEIGRIEWSLTRDSYYVADRQYIGRALGQQRWFDDLVGDKNATFNNIDEAKKFVASQLKNYPNAPTTHKDLAETTKPGE